jgi:FtsH-binding integral membrane protein
MPTSGTRASTLSLLGYSLLLPAIWMGLGTIVTVLSNGKRLGIGGLVLVVLITTTVTGWLFVRKRRRTFSGRELWLLVVYCALWAALCELSGLVYASSAGIIPAAHSRDLAFAFLVSIFIDTLYIRVGFRYTATRFIKWYLENTQTVAQQSLERTLRDKVPSES